MDSKRTHSFVTCMGTILLSSLTLYWHISLANDKPIARMLSSQQLPPLILLIGPLNTNSIAESVNDLGAGNNGIPSRFLGSNTNPSLLLLALLFLSGANWYLKSLFLFTICILVDTPIPL